MSDLQTSDPTILARMLKLDPDAPIWSANELAGLWVHQLDAPLELDLVEHQPMNDQTVHTLTTDSADAPKTFRALLQHPHPSAELLELAKDFAKSHRSGTDGLPPEIATMLYYAILAAALVHGGQRISDLSDASLKKGFNWGLQQGWADQGTHELFRAALTTC